MPTKDESENKPRNMQQWVGISENNVNPSLNNYFEWQLEKCYYFRGLGQLLANSTKFLFDNLTLLISSSLRVIIAIVFLESIYVVKISFEHFLSTKSIVANIVLLSRPGYQQFSLLSISVLPQNRLFKMSNVRVTHLLRDMKGVIPTWHECCLLSDKVKKKHETER